MSHLRLVPPPAADAVSEAAAGHVPDVAPGAAPEPAAERFGGEVVALAFFQRASGICLCRDCTKARHPAFAR